jgi:glycosyltransferase involved in cell wall biosynthesis
MKNPFFAIKLYCSKIYSFEYFERLFYKKWLKSLKKNINDYKNVNTNSPRLFWGPVPIINNKYWSNNLKSVGFESKTVMKEFYSINNSTDYDIYFEDIIKTHKQKLVPEILRYKFSDLVIFDYLLKNFDIFHIPATGLLFKGVELEKFELDVLKLLGKKIVFIPYGSDTYMYSKVRDASLQHALLLSYPQYGREEEEIESRVKRLEKNADAVIVSAMIDGISRWDVLPFSVLTIDHNIWKRSVRTSKANGTDGYVNIVHTPNHRGFKGSEFIIEAVQQLKEEGLKINLILLEKVQNSEVNRILMEDADILAEQLIFIGYAMSGLEGMSVGLPVLSNLNNEVYTRLFRRYSYLNECPILSTNPETIKDNLRILIRNPELRKELGNAGIEYSRKYHSIEANEYLFRNLYDKIWHNKESNLLNLFHPLNADSWNNKSPKIKHPLVENKIPDQLLEKLNK